MKSEDLAILLGITLLPALIECSGIHPESQIDFINDFYQSQTFELLQEPSTGLWHLSPVTIAGIYQDELNNGAICVPEEQS